MVSNRKPPYTGQSVTYGDHIDDVTFGDPKKAIGMLDNRKDNTYRLWGHMLEVSSGKVSCTNCDMEHEVPSIVQEGSAFRASVYQMYIFGEFKFTQCEPQTSLFEEPNTGTIIDIGGDQYRYTGHNEWVMMSAPHDMLSTREIVHKKQRRIEKQRRQRYGTPGLLDNSTTSRSDIGGAHHDATQPTYKINGSIEMDGSDLSDEEKKSLMEKIIDGI